MAVAPRVTFRFAEFECDAAAYQLRRNGRRVRLARQPMDLLLLLLERHGELVSREDIAHYLWGDDVFVGVDTGIRAAVLKVRRVLAVPQGAARFVETVPGKGYRFVAAVEVITRIAIPDVGGSPPGMPIPSRGRHNLPADLTSLLGREADMKEVRRLLAATRLLSLTGSGGVGKTRLAISLASEVAPQFPDGMWLVDLAALTTAALILPAIAGLLQVRESPERSLRDGVIGYLREREVLLLLDTCEHLVDGCAELAEALLRAAPRLRIVATSREALRIPGETVYRVPSLTVPPRAVGAEPGALAGFAASTLFLERASAVQPAFVLESNDVGPIAAICRSLDGIPLAIELAAAQMAAFSPEQLLGRLSNGFRTMGTRTAVIRQRTLEATVAWSFGLLSEPERLLFSRMSVFSGSWTSEAAEQVCGGDGIPGGDIPHLLASLERKSLLRVERVNRTGHRYRVLDTLRHYGAEQLRDSGATDAIRDRLFEFYYESLRGVAIRLIGAEQAAWLNHVQEEHDNLRTALDWGLSSAALGTKAVELAGALFWFWLKRGLFTEGRRWLERAEAIPAAGRLRGYVALGLGHMDYFQGRLADMNARNDEVLAWARDEGDGWLVSRALFGHALHRFESGAFAEAGLLAEESRVAARPEDFSAPLLVLGNVALARGDSERALALFEEAVEGHRQAGEQWGLGILLSLAAGLRLGSGDFPKARAQVREAITIYRELDDPRGLAWSLDLCAALLAGSGQTEAAARVWGAADALLESVGGTLVPTIAWVRDRHLTRTAASLGERRFDAARDEGRRVHTEQAINLAWSILE